MSHDTTWQYTVNLIHAGFLLPVSAYEEVLIFRSLVCYRYIARPSLACILLRNCDNRSPAPTSPLAPAAVPLPLPTLDEFLDIFLNKSTLLRVKP